MSDGKGKARASAHDWETLYRTHLPRLVGYFRIQGIDPTDTYDLTHEVFREIGQRTLPKDPNTYIYAVARNILSTYRKRQGTERAALGEYAHMVTTENEHRALEASDIGPSQEDAAAEAERILKNAAARLPAKYAELMTLRFIEGLSVKQTAQRMNCSQDVVRKRVQRLRAMLRRFERE